MKTFWAVLKLLCLLMLAFVLHRTDSHLQEKYDLPATTEGK